MVFKRKKLCERKAKNAMKWLITGFAVVSILFAGINGNMEKLTTDILNSCGEAVMLCISICGVICFWCGLMKIAEESGAVRIFVKILKPITSRIFKGLGKNSNAINLITMNIVSNFLGLGNASTPLGINAMAALKEEENATDTATDNMIMLVVLNTASLQIIPTTVAAIRLKHGTQNALEIMPCVWIVSVCALCTAIFIAKILSKLRPYNEKVINKPIKGD